MEPDTLQAIARILEALAPPGTALIAVAGGIVAARVWRRPRRQEPGFDHLSESVRDLHAAVESIRGEIARLQDRLDFTERLLARAADRLPPGA